VKYLFAMLLVIAMLTGTIYFTYRLAIAIEVVMEFDH
jgi:hypoxanthine-guanine phosphoribosyltransferase